MYDFITGKFISLSYAEHYYYPFDLNVKQFREVLLNRDECYKKLSVDF